MGFRDIIVRFWARKKIAFAVIVFVAAVAISVPTLKFNFVGLDEEDHITNRQWFLTDPSNIGLAFTRDSYFPSGYSSHYRPLLTLSFMKDAMLYGTDQVGYRVSNIVFHAVASVLVFFVLLELGSSSWAALFWSLLFAVHPAFRQIVAWIPGRNDSLLAIFLLPSFLFFVKFLRSGKWWQFALHAVFFALGLFTKETAILFPLVCAAYVYIEHGRSVGSFISSRKEKFIAVAIWWAVAYAGWFALRSHALSFVDVQATGELLKKAVYLAPAFLRYVRVAIVPFDLSVMPVVKSVDLWSGVLACAAILSLAFAFGKSVWRKLAFGGVWFLAFLLPTFISSEPQARVVFSEFRLYMPLVGLCIAGATFPWERVLRERKTRIAAAVVVLAVFSALTVYKSREMKDDLAFWQSAAKSSPSLARAHDGLGTALMSRGKVDDALNEYKTAKQIGPGEKRISNDLGVAYMRKQMFKEAEAAFKDEIAINPTFPVAYHNLAFLYAVQKRWSDAEKMWITAEVLNPWYILPHQGLAIIYAQHGFIEKSIEQIRAIQKLGVPLIPELKQFLDAYESGAIKAK